MLEHMTGQHLGAIGEPDLCSVRSGHPNGFRRNTLSIDGWIIQKGKAMIARGSESIQKTEKRKVGLFPYVLGACLSFLVVACMLSVGVLALCVAGAAVKFLFWGF